MSPSEVNQTAMQWLELKDSGRHIQVYKCSTLPAAHGDCISDRRCCEAQHVKVLSCIRICVNSQMWVTTTTCDAVYPMFNTHQLKYNDIIGISDRKCCEPLHMKVLVNLLDWDTQRDHVVITL